MWAQQAFEIWVKCVHLYLFNVVDHNLTKLPRCNVLTLFFLFFSLCTNKDGVKEIVNRPPNQDDAAKIKYHLLIDASLNRMWSGVQVVRSVPTLRTGGPFRERLSGGDERSLDQRSQDPRAFAHGKSRRRLCKRIRRMKPAGKGAERNKCCSKNRGHLGIW